MYKNGKKVFDVQTTYKRKGVKKMSKMTGTVKWWNDKKGFGFITSDIDEQDFFLHRNQLQKSGYDTLTNGTRVEFEIQESDRTGRGPSVSTIIVLKEEEQDKTKQGLREHREQTNKDPRRVISGDYPDKA
jgi:CspA family cold shock protein